MHFYTKQLLTILDSINNERITERIALIRGCISAGEWQLGIEDLCSNIIDFDVTITQEVYEKIINLAKELSVDTVYWEPLSNQIEK